MNGLDKHQWTIIFFKLHRLIATTIVIHISYQNNITLHGSTCSKLQTFYSMMIACDKHHCTIHLLCIAGITLNITLHGSTCNKLLRHFVP